MGDMRSTTTPAADANIRPSLAKVCGRSDGKPNPFTSTPDVSADRMQFSANAFSFFPLLLPQLRPHRNQFVGNHLAQQRPARPTVNRQIAIVQRGLRANTMALVIHESAESLSAQEKSF